MIILFKSYSLLKLCQNTDSGLLHMWFPDKSGKDKTKYKKEVESFPTEDPNLAVKAYERGGASLYFGSSESFRDLYCKHLSNQLGMQFSSLSEIEVFVAKAGGYTDFHIDFQENITIQLSGIKKWRL